MIVDLPPGAFSHAETVTLLAVVSGCRSLPQCVRATGYSKSHIHAATLRLRDEGLVTWEKGKANTLRPLVSGPGLSDLGVKPRRRTQRPTPIQGSPADVLLSHLRYLDDGCIEFTGRQSPNGYGRIVRDYAHRVSYEMFVGPIPAGLTVDHLCRNKLCVNPAHLEAVTLAENIRRAAAVRYGEKP